MNALFKACAMNSGPAFYRPTTAETMRYGRAATNTASDILLKSDQLQITKDKTNWRLFVSFQQNKKDNP